MKRVYIAHPLTGDGSAAWGDRERNFARYLLFCAWASQQGYAVISWAHHELAYQLGDGPDDPDYYLQRDLALLAVADEVWLCGPLAASPGMRIEEAEAIRLGICTRQDAEWLDASWVPPVEVEE